MKSKNMNSRTGAMIPMFALVMVILFVAMVFAVDVARIHVTRAELRTATDAASRAGAEALSRTQDAQAAIDAAILVAGLNTVAGRPLTITASQVELGEAQSRNGEVFNFVNGGQINAVRVTGSRESGSPDGSVSMLFGPLFGVTQFEPVQTSIAARTERDIALVLDVSGSMLSGGRIEGLRSALDAFLFELNKTPHRESVSLTVYSTTSRKRVDLTTDLTAISSAFATEAPNGLTAIGLGLLTGLDSIRNDPLARPFAQKSIVLMTDGNHNTGISPDVVAVRNPQVTVHTITFGSGANRGLMQRVARPSGGVALHAENNAQLVAAFRDIARQLAVILIE